MATIKEYLKYYKNTTFTEYHFNEMDNILFAQLSYIDWSGIVPNNSNRINLLEAINTYFSMNKPENLNQDFLQSILYNMNEIKDGSRYKNCTLSYFRKEVDNEKQFGAICIYFEPKTVYISFEGTDSSIVGWKEDFEMSYKFPIISQEYAINYVNEVVNWNDKIVYLGGHSKGGNLAMTSAMYCSTPIKRKIKNIFNNDGPGFRKEETSSPLYKEMTSKIIHFIPEECIIGTLLETPVNYTVVKAEARGVMQHNFNTWECFGTFLVKGTLSNASKRWDRRISNLIEKSSPEERETILSHLFGILEKNNINSINDISNLEWSQIVNVIESLKSIDPEIRKIYLDMFKKLILNNEI